MRGGCAIGELMGTLSEIARRLNNPAPFITAILWELGERVVNDLRQNTPGERLPSEWTYEVTATRLTIFNTRLEGDRDQWEVIFGFLNHGTRTHFVAPVRAQALHWVEGGQHFFSKGHVVSGILGAFFAERADRLIAEYERTIERRWRTWIETGRL